MVSQDRACILVVDDNAALSDNLKEILEEAGHRVRIADTCAGARVSLANPCDVALVDLRLPDGDGRDLAMDIRKSGANTAVILLTGNASVESAAASVRAGAFAYLVKPCATPELLLTVEQALRHVRLQDEKVELSRRALVAEKLAAVGTLTAGLSHEIRNPLNAAGLQLNVLERRIRKAPESLQGPMLEPLGLVQNEIRRLDHILEDFLQFARPVSFRPAPVDLSALLDRVCAISRTDAEQRGLTIQFAAPSAAVVSGHEGRLHQVFVNLVLNAMEATPRGGAIRVAAREEGRQIEVTVEDQGTGIAAEHLLHIFEPFYTTKAQGSGLGLPIVHAIVTQHAGTIGIENLPERGVRVTIRLPRAT